MNKSIQEKLQLIIAQSRPDTVLCRYDDADFEYMKDQIIALLEEARQEMKEKCLACIPIVSGRTLLEYEENGGAIASKIKDSILSL